MSMVQGPSGASGSTSYHHEKGGRMLRINERPNITEVVSTEDGYRTRTLCMIDGFPGEIEIVIDTHRQKYSSYDVSVYDYVDGRWRSLYALKYEEVGRMPILHDEDETLVRLNQVADTLWQVASTILRTARERAVELEVEEHVRKSRALDVERTLSARLPELDGLNELSPRARAFVQEATQDDFVIAGAEAAAQDASDEEAQG